MQAAEEEYLEDQPLCAVEELKPLLMSDDMRTQFRKEELNKLKGFGSFSVILRKDADSRVYGHRWVETEAKARITLKDLKVFGDRKGGVTHCPTPSSETNAILEFLALMTGYPMVCFDVVSAFPHAAENSEKIYMEAPE